MEQKRTPKIFISYRRDDAPGYAARLHDKLMGHFGDHSIFRDVTDIEGGEDFVKTIETAVNSCKILLAVIGKDWLTITERDERRLDDQKDYVRLEIATALKRGIRVIPVLVDGASVPREQDLPDDLKLLVRSHAVELSDSRWRYDAERLIKILENAVGKRSEREPDVPPPKAKLRVWNYLNSLLGGAIAGLIAGSILGLFYYIAHKNAGKDVGVGRIILISLYSLFVGATASFLINYGMARCSKLLNKSPYSKIIGATLGGALGGIIVSLVGGRLFVTQQGAPVSPQHLMWAVAFSSIFIALGSLMQEFKEEWRKTVFIIIILACVTVLTVAITMSFIPDQKIIEQYFNYGSPLFNQIKGMVMLGLVFGSMSGFQVGSTLLIYDWFADETVSTNP